MPADTQLILLDTNILLHFLLPNEINWAGILRKSEPIIIVIPVITLRELNIKTYGDSKKLKDRATTVLDWLMLNCGTDIDTESKDNEVTIIADANEPLIDFPQYKLDPKDSDDRLIASALQYLEAGYNVQIASCDRLVLFKCKSNKIAYIDMNIVDTKYRRKAIPTEEERIIAEQKKKIDELENNLPILALTFEDGSTAASKKWDEEDDNVSTENISLKREYNNDLKMILKISNNGKAPAEDVRISISSPNELDFFCESPDIRQRRQSGILLDIIPNRNPEFSTSVVNNTYSIWLAKLQHTCGCQIPIWISDCYPGIVVSLLFSIIANELPEQIQGELTVTIT